MTRLHILLAPMLWFALNLPAAAGKIPIAEISAYFNSLKLAEAPFTQVNADGTISTGRFFIHRPGRARFEYAPPDKGLVIAGGGQVAIFDPKSNTPPQQFPLARTPLGLILARHVDLARARMVVGYYSAGKTTVVVAQDPKHPDRGTIRLIFTAKPVALRQWVITNSAGERTTVKLGKLETRTKLSALLFSIPQEINRRFPE